MNLYGRSGTGKTTLACTFPKPLLILGAEDGTKSVHNLKGVEMLELTSSSDLAELIQNMEAKWKTVVLDSASTFQDLVLQEILGLNELPAQKSWGMASRDQWSQCALQVKEYLRMLLRLAEDEAVNVVVIAQERAFNAEEDGGDIIMPYVSSALMPSVTGWLNPACDYIGQTMIRRKTVVKEQVIGGKKRRVETKTNEMEYCLRIGADPVYTTKFRAPRGQAVPNVIVDPDYTKLMKYIG